MCVYWLGIGLVRPPTQRSQHAARTGEDAQQLMPFCVTSEGYTQKEGTGCVCPPFCRGEEG